MLIYALKRLGVALLVFVSISIIGFVLLRASGDPAIALAGEGASQQDVEYVRQHYGFNRPIYIQYVDWAKRALTGDLGDSIYLRQPVSQVIAERAPTTLLLGALSLCFALILAIPMGVLAALYPNSYIDRTALTIAVVGQALPTFFFSLLLIVIFGVWLHWLPIAGNSSWKNFIMPSIALGYYATPAIMRLTRAGMIEVLSSDYIRTARAKGLRRSTVLFKHALRNAVIPVVSLAAVQLGFMLGGSVIIESIFSLNGLGNLAWQTIRRSDFEVMQAVVLTIASFYILLTYLADLLNAFLDPRIRTS
ncbi:MAG: ABC transporter permease [Gammaproteobacteria bacterium CG12_big_fil_rev_8_21_14_0_65_46_12]|jgi:peptide/nickel transport system permease protein|nr:MAG: ABC transporter permease [Gammaproteobacteria bacterium CG12_big_fil_rev_8_21_14_0_65_46_12]